MFYRPDDGPRVFEQAGLKRNPFKALVAPRPIAWVSTVDAQGRANLAPYSFFNAVAEAPPILMFAPYGKKPEEGTAKDTLRNILETKAFVVNVTPARLKDAMNVSSAPFAHDVDEFEAAGLTKAACERVAAPRVAESPIAFECAFLYRAELPTTSPEIDNGVVFGEVIGVHIADEIVVDGMVDIGRVEPLARLGYMDYTSVTSTFRMDRPETG